MDNDIEQVVRRHLGAWSRGDVEGIVACFSEDCLFEDYAVEETFKGRQGVRSFARAVFNSTPNFQWTPKAIYVIGSVACTESETSGIQRATIRACRLPERASVLPTISVDEVENGLLHRHRDYYSLATFLRQVGRMPELT
jgi:steroid delta-isomerase-like uncharacterized protein